MCINVAATYSYLHGGHEVGPAWRVRQPVQASASRCDIAVSLTLELLYTHTHRLLYYCIVNIGVRKTDRLRLQVHQLSSPGLGEHAAEM